MKNDGKETVEWTTGEGFMKDIKRKILEIGATKIDYIKILDINKLIKPYKNKNKI